MYTDGGSVPRALWGVEGFSAWEYGPAYILHDWLFQRHYCRTPDFNMSFEQANAVLLDAMVLTDLKLEKNGVRNSRSREQIRTLIDTAVRKFSRHAWENGKCPPDVKAPYRIVTVTAKGGERVARGGRTVIASRGEKYTARIPNFTEIIRIRVGEGG
jgi:hypothetical protein